MKSEPMLVGPLAPDALISSLHIRLSSRSLAAKFLLPDQIKLDHKLQLKDWGKWMYNKNISSKLCAS